MRDISGDDPVTGIENKNIETPKKFVLNQNFPNPFNPATEIKFDVPKQSHIKLSIFDISGKLVETLIDEEMAASSYSITWNAGRYSSGVYFYKLDADGYSDVRKMILTK
jgi:hypothetical protein